MAASIAIERASTAKGFADIFPFEAELGKGVQSPDEVVLVDVGGGYGHVLEDIRLHVRSTLEDELVIHLPPSLKVKSLPEPMQQDTPFGAFSVSAESGKQQHDKDEIFIVA